MSTIAVVTSAVTLAVGVGAAIEAVAPPSATSGPSVGKTIRVEPTGPCPASLHGTVDVDNARDHLDKPLLPRPALFGVICWCGSSTSASYGLCHTSAVDPTTARNLTTVIDGLRTTPPGGVSSCPASFAQAAVLAFRLAGGETVDLWYADTGCQTLDNGYLCAYEARNREFSDTFIPLVTRLR